MHQIDTTCSDIRQLKFDESEVCKPQLNRIESIFLEWESGKYKVTYKRTHGGNWSELLTEREVHERIKILK